MKKFLLSILTCSAVFNIANAQWAKQDTAFTSGPLAPALINANDMYAVDANTVWVMSDKPGPAANPQYFSKQWSKTVDGGTTWTHGTIAALTDTTWRASNLVAIDANTAFVCFYGDNATTFGGVMKTSDGGVTWTTCPIAWAGAASSFPNVVHFFNANDGMVMGDPAGTDFEIFTTSNGGTTWTAVPVANIPNVVSGEFGIVDVYDAVGDTLFFGTNKGRIFKSVNKGLNWTAVQAHSNTISIGRVVCKNSNEVICSGSPTGSATVTYRKTINGGTNWTTTIPSGVVYGNGYAFVPGTATLPSFWMTYGATSSAFTNYGQSVSSDFTAFTKVDTLFHYQMEVVDANTAYAVGRYGNISGANSLEKMSSFAPYRTFLGLNNISKSNAKVGVMPNPSKGIFTVVSENLKSNVTVVLTDIMGKVVAKQIMANTGNFKLDYTSKDKGVYFLTISDNVSTLTQRIVIE
jgi:Secretion system C-terminal sorting domain/Photosynthesis system II assembly factor YCF48